VVALLLRFLVVFLRAVVQAFLALMMAPLRPLLALAEGAHSVGPPDVRLDQFRFDG
jgi:hypothetical protein